MALIFLDTSAVVKRYVAEAGHAWIVSLCDPASGHDLYIAQVTLVEAIATLCRKAREASITEAERDHLISEFRHDATASYTVIPVITATYTRAGDFCHIYPLRAYDAVQLASVLSLRDDALAAGALAPTFVCADVQLLSFAAAEGLNTENPNSFP